jgi:hypothetical protein
VSLRLLYLTLVCRLAYSADGDDRRGCLAEEQEDEVVWKFERFIPAAQIVSAESRRNGTLAPLTAVGWYQEDRFDPPAIVTD